MSATVTGEWEYYKRRVTYLRIEAELAEDPEVKRIMTAGANATQRIVDDYRRAIIGAK